MNGLALCSGIAGFDLGLKSVVPSYRSVCHVEREAFCAALLAKHMEEGALSPAPIWSDLTTFDGNEWRGVVDIVTAGYPCQPFSSAGKRLGQDDPRHLWPHVARIVSECEPTFVFLENVPEHVHIGLRCVRADLFRLGYRTQAGIFSARQCGAWHLRKRLFVFATHPNRKRELQSRRSVQAQRRRIEHSGISNDPWSVEPNVGRVADGVSNRMDRLNALGNAVVPQVVALAYSVLSQQEDAE